MVNFQNPISVYTNKFSDLANPNVTDKKSLDTVTSEAINALSEMDVTKDLSLDNLTNLKTEAEKARKAKTEKAIGKLSNFALGTYRKHNNLMKVITKIEHETKIKKGKEINIYTGFDNENCLELFSKYMELLPRLDITQPEQSPFLIINKKGEYEPATPTQVVGMINQIMKMINSINLQGPEKKNFQNSLETLRGTQKNYILGGISGLERQFKNSSRKIKIKNRKQKTYGIN